MVLLDMGGFGVFIPRSYCLDTQVIMAMGMHIDDARQQHARHSCGIVAGLSTIHHVLFSFGACFLSFDLSSRTCYRQVINPLMYCW